MNFYYAALAFGDQADETAVRSELAYFMLQKQKVFKEPTPEQVKELFALYHLPFGFHPMHRQLAEILLEQAKQAGAKDLEEEASLILREVSPQ